MVHAVRDASHMGNLETPFILTACLWAIGGMWRMWKFHTCREDEGFKPSVMEV